MHQWQRQVQSVVDEIDKCIKSHNDEALTLKYLSEKYRYSELYFSRKFKEISGMQFREYLRYRRLAFALKRSKRYEKEIFGDCVGLWVFFP